jgi:hypothetical protein
MDIDTSSKVSPGTFLLTSKISIPTNFSPLKSRIRSSFTSSLLVDFSLEKNIYNASALGSYFSFVSLNLLKFVL